MDNEAQVPAIEVVLRVYGSDELILAVFEADREELEVLVGCSDLLLFENFMAILSEVVAAGHHVKGWQSVPEPRTLPLPFKIDPSVGDSPQ